jgi:hypothetical protein
MSMGSREGGGQPPLWVTTSELARGEGHLFYRRLNELLEASPGVSLARWHVGLSNRRRGRPPSTILIAVGTALASRPPHRSGRADFPHPAPASESDAQSRGWIRMADVDGRKPPRDVVVHPIPTESGSLTSTIKGSFPKPADDTGRGSGLNIAYYCRVPWQGLHGLSSPGLCTM